MAPKRTIKGTRELQRFRAGIGKVPPELARQLRPELRQTAQPALAEVKQNASFSRRIPGATRIQVSFSKRFTGISIVTDRKKAPHARPIEHGGQPGFFRHKVYGRNIWVNQEAQPFMSPVAAELFQEGGQVDQKVGEVVDRVIRPLGFK